jgi:hypothetical protein
MRADTHHLRRRLEVAGAEIRRLRQEHQQLREQPAWAHGERRTGRRPRAVSACGRLETRPTANDRAVLLGNHPLQRQPTRCAAARRGRY